MKTFLPGIFSGLFTGGEVSVILLFSFQDLGHTVLRLTTEIRGIVTYFKIRKKVIARNFRDMSVWLDRQLLLVNWVLCPAPLYIWQYPADSACYLKTTGEFVQKSKSRSLTKLIMVPGGIFRLANA